MVEITAFEMVVVFKSMVALNGLPWLGPGMVMKIAFAAGIQFLGMGLTGFGCVVLNWMGV